MIRGELIFKKIVIFIDFIDKNKECNFHIFKKIIKFGLMKMMALKLK